MHQLCISVIIQESMSCMVLGSHGWHAPQHCFAVLAEHITWVSVQCTCRAHPILATPTLQQCQVLLDLTHDAALSWEVTGSQNIVQVAMNKMGNKLREDELHALIADADVDGNGTIDYEEFVAATVNLNKLEKEEHCMQVYSILLSSDLLQAAHQQAWPMHCAA